MKHITNLKKGNVMHNYDNWKLSNGEDDKFINEELFECELCDEYAMEDTFEEVTYKDADGDKQTKFLCEFCQEKVMMGDI